MNLNKLKKISGDASFRVFYRNKNSVLVYCNKEKKSNLLIYDAVNKILIKNKVLAPKLLSENYKKDYIEIEDFGDLTVFKKLKKKNLKKIYYYKKYYGYFYAVYKTYGKLFRSIFNMFLFTILFNKKKRTIYYARTFGIINAMLGKKSWYRVQSLFQ